MFDNRGFMTQKFEPRTKIIPVPDLKHWFKEDGKPEFKIRNLTGNEFIKTAFVVEEAKSELKKAFLEALNSENIADKVDSIKDLIGVSDSNHPELIKRLEMFVYGSVSPKVDMPFAVKFATNFPSEFSMITSEIVTLTSGGATMVKPKPSGITTKQ